jgi:hypothetical protein
MHGNVPVRFGRGRLDSLGNKGLAAYLIRKLSFIIATPRGGGDLHRNSSLTVSMSNASGSNSPPAHSSISSCSGCLGSPTASRKSP